MQEAGADVISVHYEACSNVAETLKEISNDRRNCLESGNLGKALEEIWKLADVIQVMTVHPGSEMLALY